MEEVSSPVLSFWSEGTRGLEKINPVIASVSEAVGIRKILYISGEESLKQIKLRANRMGQFSDNLSLLSETSLDIIESVILETKPDAVVIDSIQTMLREDIGSAPGSVSQVRESTNFLMQLAKGNTIPIFIVGT